MPAPLLFLSDFRILPLPHLAEQRSILDWLAAAHARAELAARGPEADLAPGGRDALAQRLRKLVMRFGCSTDRIRTRGSALDDFTHTDWERMRIFDLDRFPAGQGSAARGRVFQEVTQAAFRQAYLGDTAPDALIHVTCTGYASPSGAQRLVAERDWGAATRVLHAYHMGCYASLPALAIAAGLAATGAGRIDLVHTELCTLHLNPLLHDPEQLVVQTLFADGMIRYTGAAPDAAPAAGLEVLALHEEVIPGTEAEMAWSVGDHGMAMTLSRRVPDHIRANLAPFLARLAAKAGTSADRLVRAARFAIHPGGPRIIDEIADLLGLAAAQVQASNEVLLDHGNMSSATLPHVWKALLEDPAVEPGALVAAMAFGPGLTVSGAVLRKSA